MKLLSVIKNHIITSTGCINAAHHVLEAVEEAGLVFVIYDYMAFSPQKPARNLWAYNLAGDKLWRAQEGGQGVVDAYTHFVSLTPLTVTNFSGFVCVIDKSSGQLISSSFTK